MSVNYTLKEESRRSPVLILKIILCRFSIYGDERKVDNMIINTTISNIKIINTYGKWNESFIIENEI